MFICGRGGHVCVCMFVCVLVAQHVMSVGGRKLQIDCGIAGQWRHDSSRVSTLKEGKWRIAISITCLSVCQKAICAHRHTQHCTQLHAKGVPVPWIFCTIKIGTAG
ncbi:MAG: hypothetical protein BYD32DRAFT_412754 [Podila humilis]|nr:MAG: hypothetical protein BYD32DRAFT_412754 [Podila humilis]